MTRFKNEPLYVSSSRGNSGRCLCFAFRPAGRATSSGLARVKGWPGGAPGFLMLSKIAREEFSFASLCGEFFLAMSTPALLGVGGFGMRAMLPLGLAAVNEL